MLNFNSKINLQLTLTYGSLEYVAGLQSGELWKLRQLTGHNLTETVNAWHKRVEKAKKLIQQSPQVKKSCKKFYKKTTKALQNFIADGREGISNYLKNKQFYLVTGASRTGGTYIQSEISKAVGWPREDLLLSMTHDEVCSTPYVKYVTAGDHKIGNIGWRKPENYYNCIFQLLQLLIYFEEVVPEKRKIVLKNIHFSQCIPLLDQIFADQAHYLVTVRHPAAVSASINERDEEALSKEECKKFKTEKFNYWEVFYREFVRDGKARGKVTPLLFGPQMDEFLTQFFVDYNYKGKPSGIKITKRKYDNEYWSQENIIQRMEKIKKAWTLCDLEFPVPEKIL